MAASYHREDRAETELVDQQPIEHFNPDLNNVSLTSSQADAKALEEAAGVDLRAVPEEHSGKCVMISWILFSSVSFIFMLAASLPVPWLKDGQGRKWTVWKDVNGTPWSKIECDHKRQLFQAMEAFTIVGCLLSLGSLVAGALQMMGRGHLGVMMLFGFLTVMVSLTDWALIVNQYHKHNCAGDQVYAAGINRLDAGFGLVFISFALMLFGIIALARWMSESLSLSELHRTKYHSSALMSSFISGCVLTIATVGTAQNMWEHYDRKTSLKITYWGVEIYHRNEGLSENWPLSSYHCPQFTLHMRAGAVFSIISDAFLFFTFLFSVAAVYSRPCKWVTVGFGAVSWILLLVCSAITIAARYKTFCPSGVVPPSTAIYGAPLDTIEQRVNFKGFVITDGLGMIISAWCITTANLIYLVIKG
ncbi:Amastin surface glycofamily protein [Leishmania donovani]|uniref:Amastin surface glycofamily protein n=1 Tax=Leishmania donovani TaxID=5661 RepID=A0A504XUW6_LEIDO|nr:hypothetical protein, conserved [Leishmania donovani]TPP46649.1 Amastin surface glycofamily protein [Leishmania donovani]TPP51585.1 Amastin surface glycofamily protein [Leishmania donovani]CBZ32146.1 hypothetical protein, conserved [Leishmania donovani]